MIQIVLVAYFGGWLASAAPFYTTSKIANPNSPIPNALKALGLSAAWFFTTVIVGVVFIQDLIARYKTPTPTT